MYAYCHGDPVNYKDPSGLKLIVIVSEAEGLIDFLFGSHSLLIIDKLEEEGYITNNVLYDPSGSYNLGGRRPFGGDCLCGHDAQLRTYIDYWKGNDSKRKLKTKTEELETQIESLNKMMSEAKKVVKLEMEKSTWKSFGIQDSK